MKLYRKDNGKIDWYAIMNVVAIAVMIICLGGLTVTIQ